MRGLIHEFRSEIAHFQGGFADSLKVLTTPNIRHALGF